MKETTKAFISLGTAMIIIGSSVVAGKVLTNNFPVFLASALRFGISSIFLICMLLHKEKSYPKTSVKDKISPQGWFSLIYYAIIVTVLGFYLWYKGVYVLSASTSGVMTGLIPVSTLILSTLILGEKINLWHLSGFLLVIVGILLASKPYKNLNQEFKGEIKINQ